ncbi:hypothetical protein JRO89_XS07G0106000 [Xanthoceras sorbifolium]|uniref:RNase H type-1 domain-containing protein n=1 Tax=Xanthoceras sorbifolium TaxID=99658 RepID=A0ABQ8HTH0_9ROSI|nr:hypothetical protein JRO89_XS07G0106000 [Xanthoceras sorbifolium]
MTDHEPGQRDELHLEVTKTNAVGAPEVVGVIGSLNRVSIEHKEEKLGFVPNGVAPPNVLIKRPGPASDEQLKLSCFVAHAEALALLSGIHLTADTGLLHVVLKTDATNVVELVCLNELFLSELDLLIAEIKLQVSCIPISEVIFAPRSANMVTLSLAKLGPQASDNRLFLNVDTPTTLEFVDISEIIIKLAGAGEDHDSDLRVAQDRQLLRFLQQTVPSLRERHLPAPRDSHHHKKKLYKESVYKRISLAIEEAKYEEKNYNDESAWRDETIEVGDGSGNGSGGVSRDLNIKARSDELALLGAPFDAEDLTEKVLDSLGDDYKELVRAVQARDSSITFEELHEKLLNFESSLQTRLPPPSLFPATANPTSRNIPTWRSQSCSNNNTSWRPSNHSQNRYSTPPTNGPPSTPSNRPSRPYLGYCKICRIQGHTANKCPSFQLVPVS